MPVKQAALNQIRTLRHNLRRLAAGLAGKNLSPAPVLFANAFPKSGTHLLTQVLSGLTAMGPAVNSGLPAVVMFEGTTGARRPTESILKDLGRLRPGDIGFGHLHALPALIQTLCRSGVAPYFMYRDPRDVVVSHVYYVTEIEKSHVHHAYYRELPDFDARLQTSIVGRPELGDLFPDVQKRFEPYLGWLTQPEICLLKFETFIDAQHVALKSVLDHAIKNGFILNTSPEKALLKLAEAIDPQKSPTFRSGKVGKWRDQFTPANKQLFKDITGDLLTRLGYEKDDSW